MEDIFPSRFRETLPVLSYPGALLLVVDVLQALLLVAERQHGLITRAQALAKGLAAGAIRGRLRAGAWERGHAAVYRVAGSGRTWKQSLMASCRRELVEIAVTKTRCIGLAGLTDWSRDHERNQQLIALGWQILPITYDQMMKDPEGVVDVIRRAPEERRAG